LSFVVLLLTILRKSVKSLQNMLNELSLELELPLLTASGYSQAREHLSHGAFIELNREIIVPFYLAQAPKRYQGLRILAGDGSRIRLPEHPTIRAQFGAIATCSGQDATVISDYPCGQAYVLHDVLNKIVIEGQLARADAYEVDLAIQALNDTNESDLLLYDRNFAAYRFVATLTQRKRHFVIRCSSGSFAVAQALFAADQETSRIVTLSVPAAKKRENEQAGLPPSVTVRFVTVRLSSGELEILVTSLLDEERFPTADFKAIYNLRWGVETLFDLIKNRLSLENFSGKTAHAVLQDFHATLFISGLESLLTQDADLLLDNRSQANKLGQTVNNMVSFHTIKAQVFQLLSADDEPERLLNQLTQLFLMNPTFTHRIRDVPRREIKLNSALHYHKRLRKHCF
jgi:Transposase DDE domain